MSTISQDLKENILLYLEGNPLTSSAGIHAAIAGDKSLATIKRQLEILMNEGLIVRHGQSRNTRYSVSPASVLIRPINVDTYFEKEIDDRKILSGFNYALLLDVLPHVDLFTKEEHVKLLELQSVFKKNTGQLSSLEFKREFERLAIDLSWKSSQIEGNTYSLLETERLLKEQETAAGKTRDEATMLLNHKAALDFLLEHTDYVKPLTLQSIEDLHSLLIKDLNISRNIRQRRVGISGTNYRPLVNEHQIKEAMYEFCVLVNRRDNVFEKALLTLLLLSYIQPFADGNKRTARIVSNALLLQQNHCPISFRTVDPIDYKKALLIFYEQNNISAFKKIFIEQVAFAVNTYF